MLAFHPAAGSDTTSCQDYEEKEFVECFLEETQIIDILTHCKLQPHKQAFSIARNSSQFLLVLVSIR